MNKKHISVVIPLFNEEAMLTLAGKNELALIKCFNVPLDRFLLVVIEKNVEA